MIAATFHIIFHIPFCIRWFFFWPCQNSKHVTHFNFTIVANMKKYIVVCPFIFWTCSDLWMSTEDFIAWQEYHRVMKNVQRNDLALHKIIAIHIFLHCWNEHYMLSGYFIEVSFNTTPYTVVKITAVTQWAWLEKSCIWGGVLFVLFHTKTL